jgi:DNA repair exonuclease SbcCD ATPase subunit
MPVPLLAADTPIPQIRAHIIYTLSRLSVDPRGEPFRQKFKDLREEWKGVQLQEIDLQDARLEAGALLFYRDLDLDAFTDRVDALSERDPRLRELLFGDKTTYSFKRPTAASQLRAMEPWSETLGSPNAPAAAQAMAPEAEALVNAAKEAEATREESKRKLREFYAIGARKRFIDKVNVARGEVYSHFSKLLSDHPELRLDRRYPYTFFIQREGEAAPELEDEIALIKERIEEHHDQLDLLEAHLQQLIAQKEARDRDASEGKARQERILELQRELSVLQNKNRKKS